MAGLFGNRFVALFHNKRGDFLYSKCFDSSYKLTKKTSFECDDGFYFVDGSFSKFSPFPYLFDYYFCNYEINNPVPIKQSKFRPPLMKAKSFRNILNSTVLDKLMGARKKVFGNFFSFRNILIIVAVLLVLYYFFQGGSIDSAITTINNQIKPGVK